MPYVKGALLLRLMEQSFGRPAFDRFLSAYFEHFAFQSITTAEALRYLRKELLDLYPNESRKIRLEQWVFEPGLPEDAPVASSDALRAVQDDLAKASSWKTQQWLEYLQTRERPMDLEDMAELDAQFHLTGTGNYEILAEWLLLGVESGYAPAEERLQRFLLTVGRMKYLRPLYAALKQSPQGRERASQIYAEAKPLYHPIAQHAIERLLLFEDKVTGEQRVDP